MSLRRRHQRLRGVLGLDRLGHRDRERLIRATASTRRTPAAPCWRAGSRARARLAPAGRAATIRFTSPMRSASVASITSASSTSSLARCMPTRRGNIHEPPKSTTRPRLEKISLNRARSDAIDQIATEREVAARARGDAVDRGDRRLGEVVQPERGLARRSASRPARRRRPLAARPCRCRRGRHPSRSRRRRR